MKELCGFLVVLLCVSAESGIADDTSTEFLQGLNHPHYFKLEAPQAERSYHIYVRLPEDYANKDKRYPAVYLLDGGHTFGMLASYYRYLNFAEEVPDMIVVGISYGADGFQNGNFRGTDYTAPAQSREHYGGATSFQFFLKNNLIPRIEKQYRADSKRRIIFGQSLGGQFVLYTAQTDPSLFWGHIASNPALHRNLDVFLNQLSETGLPASYLFVANGSDDDERFSIPGNAWINHWNSVVEKPWHLKTVVLPGHGHFSAAPQSFRQGLRWLFSSKQD